MADEIKDEGGSVEQPQFTEIEQKALAQGWRPQDEWEGEPDAWRPAKEFLDRGELFRKIDEQNRTIKEFKKALDDLQKHTKTVRETEYKRAIEELKRQKKEALIEGDADAVVDLDEKLDAVREAQRSVPEPVPEVEPTIHPAFTSWVERNGWYETNEAMRAYADRIGNKLGAQGGWSPADLLAEVERQVKKEFKEKFENPNRSKPSAVEGKSNKASSKSETFQLDEQERRVMQRLVRLGVMTEDEYIKDLKEAKAQGVK
jgi:hypothetical protein